MTPTLASPPPLETAGVTDRDLQFLAQRGISRPLLSHQLRLLSAPRPRLEVVAPATVGNGIQRLSASDRSRFAKHWRSAGKHCLKFVPASGAASRMFAELVAEWQRIASPESAAATGGQLNAALAPSAAHILRQRQQLPFSLPASTQDQGRDLRAVLEHLVGDHGLRLQDRPKALLEFHCQGRRSATAFEEQLWEGLAYLPSDSGTTSFHFTVSADHREAFAAQLRRLRPELEAAAAQALRVDFSTQDPATDTVATHPDGQLFRNSDGTPHLRPGGHGSLLTNLEAAAAAGPCCVFVKNIDNVLPRAAQAEVVHWKEVLGGRLLQLRQQAFSLLAELRAARSRAAKQSSASAAAAFWHQNFGASSGPGGEPEGTVDDCIDLLNRPIRVCGMVRNQGQPGGGPFWVGSQRATLQIVESAELQDDQRELLASGTHFNPVDLALSLTDLDGKVYSLDRFVDPDRVFVARKSHEGKDLLALEHPGLWNGGMALWNTQFVEVPASTFAPVKTVFDLLAPAHQSAS